MLESNPPHTWEEKCSGEKAAPPGFPSIEFLLPLLMQAVHEKRLTEKQLLDRLYWNPRRIFRLPEQPNTYIELDKNECWTIPKGGGFSKAGWTPFEGRPVRGRVKTVVIRGETVFMDGLFLVEPGFGKNVRLTALGPAETVGKARENEALGTGQEMQLDTTGLPLADQQQQQQLLRHFRPSPERPIISSVGASLWYGRHVISVEKFTKPMVKQVLDLALRFEKGIGDGSAFENLLKRFTICLMFFEPSTRTFHSFENAMLRLDGKVSVFQRDHSSEMKGETFKDTVQMMAQYAHLLVLRHPSPNACRDAREVVRQLATGRHVPIINAGDGACEHPTQALIDLYTIREKLSSIHGKKIAIVGDLKYGRTVHSLAKILCLFRDITLHYVSPTPELGIPKDVKDYVAAHPDNVIKQVEFLSLEEGINGVDVIYMTRIQKERFAGEEDYERVKGKFELNAKVLKAATSNKEEAFLTAGRQPTPIIMHPLPRLGEINPELDTDERAVYMKQAEYGLPVRMALLTLVLRADL